MPPLFSAFLICSLALLHIEPMLASSIVVDAVIDITNGEVPKTLASKPPRRRKRVTSLVESPVRVTASLVGSPTKDQELTEMTYTKKFKDIFAKHKKKIEDDALKLHLKKYKLIQQYNKEK